MRASSPFNQRGQPLRAQTKLRGLETEGLPDA